MINISNPTIPNSSDFYLAIETMFQELIAYYRLNSDYTQKLAFDGTELTRFAGLSHYLQNYKKQQQTLPNLVNLIGFDIVIPFLFKADCKQDIELTLVILSEYCEGQGDILQNKVFDILRYTLLDPNFVWEGQIATDLTLANLTNSNPRKYRITSFSEINPQNWFQTRIDDNYIKSQLNFKLKIF